jgi:hypothetical protein
MLPLSYLEIPRHLTLPDEITDQILTALSLLSASRLSGTISLCSAILRASVTTSSLISLDQRLALFLLLAAAHEDPSLVHHYRRKATWVYEEAVIAIDASALVAASGPVRQSVVVGDEGEPTDAMYWGDDWGGEGDFEGAELREWTNGVGDLLNVLSTYQVHVEAHFTRVGQNVGEVATSDGLAARRECRQKIVDGVGAWFGRRSKPVKDPAKRVGFLAQEEMVPWKEEDLIDSYAVSPEKGSEIPLEHLVPPGVLATIEEAPRSSVATIWPGVEADAEQEAYKESLRSQQRSQASVMDIEWPIAKADYAVQPVKSNEEMIDSAHATDAPWASPPRQPVILYNDPDIFQSGRPSTGGEKAANRAMQLEGHFQRAQDWPLTPREYRPPETQWQPEPRQPLQNWNLNEHYLPGDLPQYTEQTPAPAALPFHYNIVPSIAPPDRPPTRRGPSFEGQEITTTRRPMSSIPEPPDLPPDINHADQNKRIEAVAKENRSDETKPKEQQNPVKPLPKKDDPDDGVVADPYLVNSGIWKMIS